MDSNIRQWMKENNYSEEDLDFMWDFLAAFDHRVVSPLDNAGKGWKDLSFPALKTLTEEYRRIRNKEIFDN